MVLTAAACMLHNEAVEQSLDGIGLLGIAGFGVSLQLIHIYVTPLKRALQALWGLGTAGALYLMATQDTPVALYVIEHPSGVWLVGPLFAALTGVAVKEGLCYGKWEAGALFGLIPLVMLGHLTQLVPQAAEQGLAGLMVALFLLFAARKYTQPVKDDIGDKSVFEFMKLSSEEQEKELQRVKGLSSRVAGGSEDEAL